MHRDGECTRLFPLSCRGNAGLAVRNDVDGRATEGPKLGENTTGLLWENNGARPARRVQGVGGQQVPLPRRRHQRSAIKAGRHEMAHPDEIEGGGVRVPNKTWKTSYKTLPTKAPCPRPALRT